MYILRNNREGQEETLHLETEIKSQNKIDYYQKTDRFSFKS